MVPASVYEAARRDANSGTFPLHTLGSAIVGLSGLACPVGVFHTTLGGVPLLFAFNATDASVRMLMRRNLGRREFPVVLLNSDEERMRAPARNVPVFEFALKDVSEAGAVDMEAYVSSAPLALAVMARRLGGDVDGAPAPSWICLTAEQYPTSTSGETNSPNLAECNSSLD